jgi:hypothetical protein
MLREFMETFRESNGSDLADLWTYSGEVKGIEQLMFLGNMAALTERQGPMFSLVVASNDLKVFDHTRYLIQCLWSYLRDDFDDAELRIELYGKAYQSIIPLKPLYNIEDVYSAGTVERVDRFENHSEKQVRTLTAVIFRGDKK